MPPARRGNVSQRAEPPGKGTNEPVIGGSFAARVIDWHDRHGRHDLPWQNTRDPYRIWLSEVMLQQTQVTTVLGYYARFLETFPTLAALAAAPAESVLGLWSGLGYYRRAHHLHDAAKLIVREYGGAFPREVDQIAALPGIGRSTAAAIAAFAFGTRGAILDGNVKRVLARHRGIEGYPGDPKVEAVLWPIAESALPDERIGVYTQAMMDVGATVCVRMRPHCEVCPVAQDCVARATRRVDELPMARPARVLPQRVVNVALIESCGTWLFEERPGAGVWPGLWSLPELAREDDVANACRLRFGVDVADVTTLPPLEHAFTHYRLTLYPLRIAAHNTPHAVNAPGRAWLTPAAALAGALPAPIKRIVRAHCTLPDLFAAADA